MVAQDRAPGDLMIKLTLGGTQQFQSAYTYTIRMDGTVTFEDRSHSLPVRPEYPLALTPRQTEPERALRLTDEQLNSLVDAFADAEFYSMQDSYYGEPDADGRVLCVNHAQSKALSITANGRTKEVSFFPGCDYTDKTPVKAFLSLYDNVSGMIAKVRAEPVK